MTSNEAFALILSTLSTLMSQQGYAISVQASYQPTQQGTQNGPFIAVNYISSRRYGYPQVTEKINAETGTIDRVESYWLEEVFQIGAYAIPSPTDIASPTAYTYAARAAAVLQSQQARNILLKQGVGFIRISEIRMPFFEDERGRNELTPSFDFTVSRQEQLIYSVPIVVDLSVDIKRV